MPYRLRTRLAPTPSGHLHLGNAWSFALTWLAARSRDGRVHLRIDDLDAARLRDDYVEDIFASLRWLGLDWDSGPRDAAEFRAAHSQRLRLDRYREALDRLRSANRVYACGCSRAEAKRAAEQRGSVGYPGSCRDKGLADDPETRTLRYRVPAGAVRARDAAGGAFDLRPDRDMGDFILRQRNGDPSYQLASVADDADAGINFVVRGLDLMPSTGAQLRLAEALGCETFVNARFWHHALVLDDAGEKLSKSLNAESLQALRERFLTPEPIYRFFATALGRSGGGVRSIRDLLEGFDPERVSRAPLRLSDFWRSLG